MLTILVGTNVGTVAEEASLFGGKPEWVVAIAMGYAVFYTSNPRACGE